jgi:CarD family transcriptional regulator
MNTELNAVSQEQLAYQIGNTIVHPVHGIGVITGVDEVKQAGQSRLCYVIAIHDRVTLWVPVDAAAQSGLRSLASATGFRAVSTILSSAAQPLDEQARERQIEINERFKEGTLEAICSIIRDLTVRSLSKKLNEHDAKMLKRARRLLLDEWVMVMDMVEKEAQSQLSALLHESATLSGQGA